MITFKYPLVKQWTLYRLFYPFVAFLLFYVTFMNVIYDNRGSSSWMMTVSFLFEGILFLFSVYFLKNELSQIFDDPSDYLLQIWNYIDLFPPFLIFAFLAMDLWSLFSSAVTKDGALVSDFNVETEA